MILLVEEFRSRKSVHTFSSIRDHVIPKSLKCTHSATKLLQAYGFRASGPSVDFGDQVAVPTP